VARTGENITYAAGRPAFVLLDHDAKGMPAEIAAKIEGLGGFWAALAFVLPALNDTGRVTRRSTSAGLIRIDTGEKLPGSNGVHGHVIATDGTDAVRFLEALHDRCWLAGLGWCIVSKSGALLERSIVDKMVGQPERLVFEGPPVLERPLKQDKEARHPKVHHGDRLDTRGACPSLTASRSSPRRATTQSSWAT
jgi:hypothetical protein